MLSDFQRTNVRRHMGYPVVGMPFQSPVGGASMAHGFPGFRYFEISSTLEFRLQYMMPFEESFITGFAAGLVSVRRTDGQDPRSPFAAGVAASLVITQAPAPPVTVTVITAEGDDSFALAINLANAAAADPTLAAAGITATAPLNGGGNWPANTTPIPSLQITAPLSFTVASSAVAPAMAYAEPASGSLPPLQVVIDEVTYYGYLQILDVLQGRVATASENLDTLKADVWTARPDEMEAREALYQNWRLKLARYLDVPLWDKTGYPAVNRFHGSGGKRGNRSIVV